MQEYRCTRNAPYLHDCLGQDDISARQGYYIWANGTEDAWQKMAIRFPEEVTQGFTVDPWEGFNVTVVEIQNQN
jgi:hypothetical protein